MRSTHRPATPRVPAAPPVADAAQVLARGSRSFSFASWFLPGHARRDAAVLYAFCRHVDDVADESGDAEVARRALDALIDELEGRRPARPLIAAVSEVLSRRDSDVRHAVDLVRGVGEDLDEVRLADDAALVRYGYLVAGTVGLMMCGVLGVRAPEARPFAVDLGVAMQITNICRDVREDALRGRVYLPATRLRAVGIEPTPEGVLAAGPAIRRVTFDLVAKADRYYRSAADGFRHIPWRTRIAIAVASQVYAAIGHRLVRHGADPLQGRTVVPFAEKVSRALGALARVLLLPRPLRPHRPQLHRALVGLPGADPSAREV